jgi:hypothetical protein
VRVFAGLVRSVTMMNSAHLGAGTVVNAEGVPTGSYVGKTGGGLVLLGYQHNHPLVGHDPLDANLIVGHVSPNYPGDRPAKGPQIPTRCAKPTKSLG